jgi:hypothetical protein
MHLRLEAGPGPSIGHQLSFLAALDAATPLHLSARPPTPAMLRALALAALRPDGEVKPGSLSPGAFNALCAAMTVCGLVRVECGAPVITVGGRLAIAAAESRNNVPTVSGGEG